MEPLVVQPGLIIPPDHLAVAFTRSLEGADAVEAARSTPSTVELRFDTRGCPGFGPHEVQRILALPALKADRRGTVRVVCSEFRSRVKNLMGARVYLRELILEALSRDLPEAPPAPPRKRGRAGLIKSPD